MSGTVSAFLSEQLTKRKEVELSLCFIHVNETLMTGDGFFNCSSVKIISSTYIH